MDPAAVDAEREAGRGDRPGGDKATEAAFSFGSTRSATWSVPGTTPLVTTFTPVLCTVQPVPTAAPRYTVHDGRPLPPVPPGGADGDKAGDGSRPGTCKTRHGGQDGDADANANGHSGPAR